jgi:hypothetical protein
MKPHKVKIFLLAFFFSFTVFADLYKGIDDDGNVIYSDKPINNSKKFTPPSLTIVDAPKVAPKKETASKAPEKDNTDDEKATGYKYKTFKITAPANDETIWNQPQLMVELSVKPELNKAEGHNIWLLMDGRPLVKKSNKLSLPIGRADRGTHTLQAQIKDKKGKVLKRTKTITIYIKHAVITKKPIAIKQ